MDAPLQALRQAFKDRRLAFVAAGGAVALLAGLALAMGLMNKHKGEEGETPPAAQGGLVVETGTASDGQLDPKARLRCFVAGQFVGEETLADCAKKNGVATGALDVGVDESGNLAAADQAGMLLAPLPPPAAGTPAPVVTLAPPAAASAPAVAQGPAGACWRYAGGSWSRLPTEMGLNACVQTLFAGRCEKPGGATYGRWMAQTLRLAPGKVEISGDNRSFRTLVEQGAGCALPTVE